MDNKNNNSNDNDNDNNMNMPPVDNGPMNMPPANSPTAFQAPVQTNTMAILSLVFAFVFTPAGLVMGIVALNQIKKTGEQGKGLAIAGIVVSAISLVLIVLWIVFLIIAAVAASSTPSYY